MRGGTKCFIWHLNIYGKFKNKELKIGDIKKDKYILSKAHHELVLYITPCFVIKLAIEGGALKLLPFFCSLVGNFFIKKAENEKCEISVNFLQN